MQRDAKNRLAAMRYVGDSPFNLVVYLAYYCVHAIIWALVTSAVLFVGTQLYLYWRTGHVSVLMFYPVFFGCLLGRATKLYTFLGSLMNREKTIKMLEKIATGERLD